MAITGVALISFNNAVVFELRPLGGLLRDVELRLPPAQEDRSAQEFDGTSFLSGEANASHLTILKYCNT